MATSGGAARRGGGVNRGHQGDAQYSDGHSYLIILSNLTVNKIIIKLIIFKSFYFPPLLKSEAALEKSGHVMSATG